jgi:hypothetical protein
MSPRHLSILLALHELQTLALRAARAALHGEQK